MRLWLRGEIDLIGGFAGRPAKGTGRGLPIKTSKSSRPVSRICKSPAGQLFCHHMLAGVEMFSRDAERISEVPPREPPAAMLLHWPAPATAGPRTRCHHTAWSMSKASRRSA
jgi:hypothetical protein